MRHRDGGGCGRCAGGGDADLTSARRRRSGHYHNLNFCGRSANIAVGIPYGVGNFNGKAFDVPKYACRSGLLDSLVRLSVNLKGGPAMKAPEFMKWRQHILLGASPKIVAPTGQYNPTQLINWGNNRWAFKPEFGYSERWGHWVLDTYTGLWFFTTNPELFSHNGYFPGTQSFSESPVGSFEVHLS
jgi:Putative MetA-pathway of phenol degradation